MVIDEQRFRRADQLGRRPIRRGAGRTAEFGEHRPSAARFIDDDRRMRRPGVGVLSPERRIDSFPHERGENFPRKIVVAEHSRVAAACAEPRRRDQGRAR